MFSSPPARRAGEPVSVAMERASTKQNTVVMREAHIDGAARGGAARGGAGKYRFLGGAAVRRCALFLDA